MTNPDFGSEATCPYRPGNGLWAHWVHLIAGPASTEPRKCPGCAPTSRPPPRLALGTPSDKPGSRATPFAPSGSQTSPNLLEGAGTGEEALPRMEPVGNAPNSSPEHPPSPNPQRSQVVLDRSPPTANSPTPARYRSPPAADSLTPATAHYLVACDDCPLRPSERPDRRPPPPSRRSAEELQSPPSETAASSSSVRSVIAR